MQAHTGQAKPVGEGDESIGFYTGRPAMASDARPRGCRPDAQAQIMASRDTTR